MTRDEQARLLDSFLASRGMSRDALLRIAADLFGRPLLVVATGSILHGVGNSQSDIDLNVVVEPPVSRLPIATHEREVLVDTAYFSASEVERWMRAVRDEPWPAAGRVGRERWRERYDQLLHCTRIGYGFMLSARDGWDERVAAVREPWMSAAVAQWWHTESIRRQVAGRWLAAAKPLLAAQHQLDAVLAALECRAARAGHLYIGPKWLSEKLRALDDRSGLEALRAAMRAPTTDADAGSYIARAEETLEALRGAPRDGLGVQLWYAAGVRTRTLDGRTLVSRWDLRGVEVRGAALPPATASEPVWEGDLAVPPPPHVLALFAGDMTWLSMVARPA